MDYTEFDIAKKQFTSDLIKDLEGIELPPEWRPRDVLRFVIRKIENLEKKW